MGKENQIDGMVSTFIDKVKNMIDVDTVIGTPFETKDGLLLIPITKVSVGFVSGGGEYGCEKKVVKITESLPFAGGGAGGVSVSPIGFLEIKGGNCRLIRLDEKSVYQTILDKIPSILDGVSSLVKKEDKCKNG